MAGARPLLLVTGIADGLGTSIAANFARAGYDILGLGAKRQGGCLDRHPRCGDGGRIHPSPSDVTKAADVAAALEPYLGKISVVVHNAQAFLNKPFDQIEAGGGVRKRSGRVTCLGAMTVARLVLPQMVAAGHGTIILTGASAGLRGNAKFAAFASAKFALRGLAQSLAREYGPAGIHVAHVVIDGLVDGPQTEQRFGPAQSVRMVPTRLPEPISAWLSRSRHPGHTSWTCAPMRSRFEE